MNKNLKFVGLLRLILKKPLILSTKFLVKSEINIDIYGVEKYLKIITIHLLFDIKHLEFIKKKLKPSRGFKFKILIIMMYLELLFHLEWL